MSTIVKTGKETEHSVWNANKSFHSHNSLQRQKALLIIYQLAFEICEWWVAQVTSTEFINSDLQF
jgi:hypothetical protein